MKVFFASCVIGLWLVFSGLWTARAAAEEAPLLVLEVSAEDVAAADRLSELVAQPMERRALPEARDPAAASSALSASGAGRALVLDSAARRVQLIERDGQLRTRLIEAEATPYLTAFVASELLALAPPVASVSAPQPSQEEPPSRVARAAGQLALDVSSPYTTRWIARPKLGLELWLGPKTWQRALFALGAELVIPTPLSERNAEGRISLLRWDAGLRAGAAFPINAWRLLPFVSGRTAITRADSTATANAQHTVGLGLGLGFQVERSLTKWLGLFLGLDAHALLRRSAYELAGAPLLEERFLMISADFGLVLKGERR